MGLVPKTLDCCELVLGTLSSWLSSYGLYCCGIDWDVVDPVTLGLLGVCEDILCCGLDPNWGLLGWVSVTEEGDSNWDGDFGINSVVSSFS